MTEYNILTYPNDVLRVICAPVRDEEFGPQMDQFVQNMYRLMEEGKGIGLAAPQIGVAKNILVYKTIGEAEEKNACLINPKIVQTEGDVIVEEGCLSLPGIFAKVPRFDAIQVVGRDPWGNEIKVETDTFSSIIIQHESDHLMGKLFIDKLSPLKQKMVLAKYKKKQKNA